MKKREQSESRLSPMQRAMLFDHLTADTPELDVLQVIGTLHDSLDAAVFARAWEQTVKCHPALRTYFHWQDKSDPMRVVDSQIRIPLEFLDWGENSRDQQQEKVDQLIEADRIRGFDLSRPPLARLSIIRLGPSSHVMILTVHHVIMDAVCLRVLTRDVFTVYEAELSNEPILPAPNQLAEDRVGASGIHNRSEEKAFWKKLLGGFTAPNPLPSIRRLASRNESGGRRGETETLLPEVTTKELRQLASSLDVTLNTLVQAAWAILLSRYCDEDDIVFGAVRRVQSAERSETGPPLGLFINTLPMRIQVEGSITLGKFVRRLRAQHLAIRPFKHTPIADIRRWNNIRGRLELFRTVVVFNNESLGQILQSQGGSWHRREFRLAESLSSIPLGLYADADSSLRLKLVYNRGRFDDASAARVIDHVKCLLSEMPHHADNAVKNLPMLTAAEMQLLDQWNGKRQEFTPVCVHKLIEKQVRLSPEVLALTSTAGELTYSKLDRIANSLACELQQIGVGPDVLVGIYLTRSNEMIVSVLATLKAGGAYLPLDPEFPKARLEYMLKDAQVTVVLTESLLAGNLPPNMPHVIEVDHRSEVKPEVLDALPESAASSANLAYVIYTSGSTGNPKGVMLEHRNVANFFSAMDECVDYTSGDVWLAVTSLSFDISVLEILWTLSRGFTVAIYRDEKDDQDTQGQPAGGFQVGEYLKRYGVTHIQCTPSMALMMTMDETCRKEMHCLKQFLIGGEAFPYDLAAELRGLTQAEIINMYGPTETTIWSSSFPISPGNFESLAVDSVIPIGRPILNNVFRVLDRHLQPVPPGVAGELFIGGEGIARGYLNLPALTGERFISDPFDKKPGARLYRTGDLVRYERDGCMQFLGRMDFQVKIRGHRIEPAEIEQQIQQYPGIDQAAVVEQGYGAGDKHLLACIVATEGRRIYANELKEHLRGRLPEYMMPAEFLFLDSFPLTPNKKLDRKALAALRPKLAASGDGKERYQNDLESQVADIWKKVLGTREIGRNENFFDIGGDSFRAMKLHYMLRKELELELSLTDIFKYSTIQLMGNFMGQQDSSGDALREGIRRGKARRIRLSSRKDNRKD